MSENPERNEMRRPCSCSGTISWRPSVSADDWSIGFHNYLAFFT